MKSPKYYDVKLRNGMIRYRCRYIGESFLYHSLRDDTSGKWLHIRKTTFDGRCAMVAPPVVVSPART